MTTATAELEQLLARLDPGAGLAERHLWLLELTGWVRGDQASVPAALDRVQAFIDAVDARPELQSRLQAWWQVLVETVDITTLLADFGFAPRNAMVSEMAARLRHKLLPGSPETLDASELFSLALPTAFDAQWLAAVPEPQLNRLVRLLAGPDNQGLQWKTALLDAITYCAGQILANGFSPEL
ncbi:MAG: recombinase, partial [Burkholderiaceae bacterium]|nr:recombinase [Burkholderiaceae bacterium]